MPDFATLNVKLDNLKEDVDEVKIDLKTLNGTLMTRDHCQEIQGRCHERLDTKADTLEVRVIQADMRIMKRLLWLLVGAVVVAVMRDYVVGRLLP